jgi:pantetheine-phosphate adenylyltransferase
MGIPWSRSDDAPTERKCPTPSGRTVVRVLYPGSFDPLHNGHVDVIEAASRLFDGVVVAILVNPQKDSSVFGMDERRAMVEESVGHLPEVSVVTFAGLAVDAAIAAGADAIVKGLRTVSDFDVEMTMAQTNLAVSGVPTVFLPSAPATGFVASRYVREIAREGRDVSGLVPAAVARRLKERFGR